MITPLHLIITIALIIVIKIIFSYLQRRCCYVRQA